MLGRTAFPGANNGGSLRILPYSMLQYESRDIVFVVLNPALNFATIRPWPFSLLLFRFCVSSILN